MNPWKGLGGLPREVWILAGATLLNRMGTMALPFLALYLTRAMGFSPARAGEAMLVYGAGALIAAPFSGHFADRVGPVKVMRLALVLSGLFMAAIPFARSWSLILLLVALWALAAEGFRPASLAILTELAPESRRKAVFSLNRLAINLGMSLGPVLGGLLAEHSFHALFWVDAATALASASVLTAFVRANHRPDGRAPSHPFITLKDRRFALFLLATVPVMIVFLQHEGAMPVFLVNRLGFSTAFYGSLFTLNTGLILLLEVRLNLATAHWPNALTLAFGAACCAIGFGALAFVHSALGIAFTVVVWTFGEMILMPAMGDHVAHLAPPDRRGAYMGIYAMAIGSAFLIGPWLGLVMLGHVGGTILWLAMGALGLGSAFTFWRVARVSAPAPA